MSKVIKLSGEMKELKICPICKQAFSGMGAISRKDNITEICSNCGLNEALAAYFEFIDNRKEDE